MTTIDAPRRTWTIVPDAGESVAAAIVGRELRPGEPHDLPNPATGNAFASVGWAGEDVAAEAVGAASAASRAWAATPARARAAALRAIADELRAHADEIADLIVLETGKRHPEAAGEVQFSATYFDWFAEAATQPRDEHLVTAARRFVVRRQPVGVVAAVNPWNFPVSIPARKAAPALAAGCPVVLKLSELTPLSGLAFAWVAGRHLPPGVLNAVTGDGERLTPALVDHPATAAVTFTGSTRVGTLVAQRAMGSMTRVTMELGGKAPFVICADADPARAVEELMIAKFRNNGASCIAANNVYVHRDLHDSVLATMAERVAAMRVGDPFEPDCDLGPLIRPEHVHRLRASVESAREEGCRTWSREVPADGWFCEPTVVEAQPTSTLDADEIFGPVCVIRPYDDEDALVDEVNSWRSGLGGYVVGTDIEHAVDLAARLQIGIVGINNGAPNTPEVPFGGFAMAGLGREGGVSGMLEFTEEQTISVAR